MKKSIEKNMKKGHNKVGVKIDYIDNLATIAEALSKAIFLVLAW